MSETRGSICECEDMPGSGVFGCSIGCECRCHDMERERDEARKERDHHASRACGLSADLNEAQHTFRDVEGSEQYLALLARLEKAEARVEEEQEQYINLLDDRDAKVRQLEAMRAALKEAAEFPTRHSGRWHLVGHTGPGDCQGCRIEAALAPSAMSRTRTLRTTSLRPSARGSHDLDSK